MAALYTKYRPKKFAEVVGQQAIVQTLKNAIKQGTPGHAYLFTGSRGVGKTSLARIFAKAVNCQSNTEGEPCLTCSICTSIGNGNFLDCIEIDAASHTGVDNIRNLIEGVAFRPSSAKYKIYIIDEVHMLSKGAFNALLKTLEEPPEHAVFILATTEVQKVPATILSRTQRFDFGRLTEKEIADHLAEVIKTEGRKAEDVVLFTIASHASGSLRDSLTRLEKLLTLEGDITLLQARGILGVSDLSLVQELLTIVSSEPNQIPTFFENFKQFSLDPAVFNRDLLEYLRSVLDASMGYISQQIISEKESEVFKQHVAKFSVNDLVFLSRIYLKSYKDLSISPSPELPLYLASCEACQKFNASPKAQPAQVVVPAPAVASILETLAEEPIKKNEPKPEEAISTIGVVIDEQKVTMLWSQVIDTIKVQNGPLGTLMKNSPLLGFENGIIWVGVKYLFHKEQLENARSSQLLANALEQICGIKARILPRLVKAEEKAAVPAQALQDAIQVFGGELVE